MGIDLPAFEFLLRASNTFGSFGKTVILGRQRMLWFKEGAMPRYERVLKEHRPDLTIAQIDHEYVDKMLEALAGQPNLTMDNSAYEGAEVIHDLNEPLPDKLVEQFDTVIDIGTMEHVFNIGEAMRSMARLVRSGGQFLMLNIADNHLGHGFWQFSPEALFRTFSHENGFEPWMADLFYQNAFHPLRDPEQAGRRLPIKTPGYTYITFGARKVASRPVFPNGWPIQADYKAAWIMFQSDQEWRGGNAAKAEAILREAIETYPKNPMYHAKLAQLLHQVDPLGGKAERHLQDALALADDNPAVETIRKQVMGDADAALRPDTISVGSVRAIIDDPRISEPTRAALYSDNYEFAERDVAHRFLAKGDRVIELGCGMGIVSMTIAKIVGAHAVRSYEAHPLIIDVARANMAENKLDIDLRGVIALPRVQSATMTEIEFFYFDKSFAASSMHKLAPNQKSVQVPVVTLEDAIAETRANTLVFDIEGAEENLVQDLDFTGIEKISFEIHPKILGFDKAAGLVATLEDKGFFLRADLLLGEVVSFDRNRPFHGAAGVDVFTAYMAVNFEGVEGYPSPGAMDPVVGKALRTNQNFNLLMALREFSKDRTKALAAAEEAMEKGQSDYRRWPPLGEAYLVEGNAAKARQMAKKTIAVSERNVKAWMLLAHVAKHEGDTAKATEHLRTALSHVPEGAAQDAQRQQIAEELSAL